MHKTLLTVFLLAGASIASAQELTLFEATETDFEQGPQVQQQVVALAAIGNSQPAFVLKGLSRFGDDFHIVLLNRAGESTRLRWRQGERTAVPGAPAFAVLGVESGALLLAHPPMEPCLALEASGISCRADNVAVLRVATAAPLASNGTQEQNAGRGRNAGAAASAAVEQGVVVGPDAAGPGFFINPFNGEAQPVPNLTPEQQAVVERQQQRAARLRNTEPVRIEDIDVPPGMRVVRTPFGDRLVPVRE